MRHKYLYETEEEFDDDLDEADDYADIMELIDFCAGGEDNW